MNSMKQESLMLIVVVGYVLVIPIEYVFSAFMGAQTLPLWKLSSHLLPH